MLSSFKKTLVVCLFCGVVFGGALWYLFYWALFSAYQLENLSDLSRSVRAGKQVCATPYIHGGQPHKIILMWTSMHGVKLDFAPDRQPSWLEQCPDFRCQFSTRRSALKSADAVFFSMPDLGDISELPLHSERKPSQYFVFYNDESPATTKRLVSDWHAWRSLRNYFNLTMTYRSDADIPTGHYNKGYIPHTVDLNKRDPSWFERKRDVLWIVSNCHTASRREDIVARLSRYTTVDRYGRCNLRPVNCTHRPNCPSDLIQQYKLYLSFENSLCVDYATEKLFRALNEDVVPVVLGGANYSAILPYSAVINAEDFLSVEHLGSHIQSLVRNQTAYEYHLKWKYSGQHVWQLPIASSLSSSQWCTLCQLLNQPVAKRVKKVYPDISEWFFRKQCRLPKNYLFH